MIYHYAGCNQIPGTCDNVPFELPKYGPSTTDPTYYEPTATRIANMKRSAGAFQGLYDFTGSLEGKTSEDKADNALKQLSSASVDVRYSKHGLTKEEVSQITMEKSLEADSMIKDKKQAKKDNSESLKKELEVAEAVASKLSEKDSADTSTSE